MPRHPAGGRTNLQADLLGDGGASPLHDDPMSSSAPPASPPISDAGDGGGLLRRRASSAKDHPDRHKELAILSIMCQGIIFLSCIAGCYALVYFQTVFIPFTFAVFLSYVIEPVVQLIMKAEGMALGWCGCCKGKTAATNELTSPSRASSRGSLQQMGVGGGASSYLFGDTRPRGDGSLDSNGAGFSARTTGSVSSSLAPTVSTVQVCLLLYLLPTNVN